MALAVLLSANGINSILGGFETSRHVLVKRSFLRQYAVSLMLAIVLSLLLLVTVAAIVVAEVVLQTTKIDDVFSEKIPIIVYSRYIFVGLMILCATSFLLKFGTKHTGKRSFISIGSVFTTILIILSSYAFGIWVVKFSNYNELYGSIGTLLIFMFYIWINCIVLLLGFELNSAVNRAKHRSVFDR